MTDTPSFPALKARTRGFTLGRPRAFRVAPDGSRVLFLRSPAGDDPVNSLWALDLPDGVERRLVDARAAVADGDDRLPPEERARRERAREVAGGIVGYATDRDLGTAAFALAGRLFTVDVATGSPTEEATAGTAFDPRPSPDGRHVAYTCDGALHVVARGGATRTVVAEPGVSWGLAEFVAAEEMGRMRGHWWSPDGGRLLAARVDESRVPVWYIADPANPDRAPTPHRYPAAGTTNADVSLAILPLDGGDRVDVAWDGGGFPYLAAVHWGPVGPLTLLVQDRAQTRWQVLAVDPASGRTRVVREDHDDAWLFLVPGVPAWLDDDQLVMVVDVERDGRLTRAVVVDGEAVTPSGLDVSEVLEVSEHAIWFVGAETPFDQHVYRFDCDRGTVTRCTDRPGVHAAAVAGDTAVVVSATMEEPTPTAAVRRHDRSPVPVVSYATIPPVTAEVEFLQLGPRRLPAALLRPRTGPLAGSDAPLPVVLSPYGGPGPHPRVQRAQAWFLEQQWLADQGFAVLVVDNRGMPNLGPAGEREVKYDLATPVLDDQVEALQAAAERLPLDLDRVGVRGWSFGGFLAALAVLRRPDVFRAGVAGAPVTDWRLYDTHYTERYLGLPQERPEAYRVSSLVGPDGELVDPAPLPAGRPPPGLLVIHGLADDNVVAAHALRLSTALLAAGRPHRFLPLSGVTHMTPQEVVAERLLTAQVEFLREHLGA